MQQTLELTVVSPVRLNRGRKPEYPSFCRMELRGSRKTVYDRYLESAAWQRIRLLALDRAKGVCEWCPRPEGEKLHVHHHHYPEDVEHTTLDHVVAICRRCHQGAHGIEVDPDPDGFVPRRDFKPWVNPMLINAAKAKMKSIRDENERLREALNKADAFIDGASNQIKSALFHS